MWVISSNYSVLLISCLSSSVGRSSSASVIHRNLSILSVRRNLPTNSILTLKPFVSFRCCQRRKVCQHPLSSVNGSAASSLGVLFSWCCSELTVEQILTIKPGKYSDVHVVFACSAAWSPTEPRLLLRFFRSARWIELILLQLECEAADRFTEETRNFTDGDQKILLLLYY